MLSGIPKGLEFLRAVRSTHPRVIRMQGLQDRGCRIYGLISGSRLKMVQGVGSSVYDIGMMDIRVSGVRRLRD